MRETLAQILFEPVRIGTLDLPNRIVMAPMSRRFSQDGVMPPAYVDYYRRRAAADVGLILSECAGVDHASARRLPSYPSFHGAEALSRWREVIDAVHEAGGRMMPQIWHAGATKIAGSEPNPQVDPASPSGLFMPIDGQGGDAVMATRPMSDSAIADVVAAFGQAAADACALGFDGVEIHGAHGYLIDQFLWPAMNLRADHYGANGAESATRFAAEIVAECRRRTTPDFPLFFRFSQWKQQDYAATLASGPAALEALLRPLVDAGVTLFHCSLRRYWEAAFAGDPLTLAGWTSRISGLPVCTVGSVGLDTAFGAQDRGTGDGYRSRPASLDGLVTLFERGEFDLVAVGRALISDPLWAQKVRQGRIDAHKPYSTADLETLY
ncbi:oxidoreductase [Sphingobium sp. JAI105]|nr:12-oxophytodienoate reductase [Sphingobium sp. JAI105]